MTDWPPSPTQSVLQDLTRWPALFSGAKLNPVVKNYICLEIWNLSGSPISQHPPVEETVEEAGKQIRTRAIKRKENYTSLIYERTAPESLSSECLQVS